MARLDDVLQRAAHERRGVFMPFVVIGDPDLATCADLTDELVEAGADVLEFGFAFSDPPADGPVIQAADERALRGGITTARAFEFLAAVHARHPATPVALLLYYNLVVQFGVDAFYARAAACGVDAILIADLPLELADEALTAAKRHGVAPIFIATELSTDERLVRIAEVARGYLYAVARLGVTGEQHALQSGLADHVARFKRSVPLPCLVGFGISSAEHVRGVLDAGADGVIVGSAIVRHVAQHLGDPVAMRAQVGALARALKAATSRRPLSEQTSC